VNNFDLCRLAERGGLAKAILERAGLPPAIPERAGLPPLRFGDPVLEGLKSMLEGRFSIVHFGKSRPQYAVFT